MLNEIVDEDTIAYRSKPNILMFPINDMGNRKMIKYDILNDRVLEEDAYVMVNFHIIEVVPEKDLLYVGTLCKTDVEDGIYNIKIAGRLRRNFNQESLPYLTFPEQ